MTVAVTDVTKVYPPRVRRDRPVVAVDAVSLEAPDTELLVIVGPSGSGKTSLLRCIAGLEDVNSGTVRVGDEDVTSAPPGRRDVAMVFQEYALFPHLSVLDNITFGLRARKTKVQDATSAATEAAASLGIDGVLHRRPRELSGGERQRVALARAIVRRPRAFLMDEPLSNLDAELRAQMRAEIRGLQRSLLTTTIYVTHDQVEALTMGDRVAVLRAGKLEQIAPPEEIYDHPATAFVARFIGSPPMNLFPEGLQRGPHGAATIGIRPERIRIGPHDEARLAGHVKFVEPIGGDMLVHVDVQGHDFIVRAPRHEAPAAGTPIGLNFLDEDLHGFESIDGPAVR